MSIVKFIGFSFLSVLIATFSSPQKVNEVWIPLFKKFQVIMSVWTFKKLALRIAWIVSMPFLLVYLGILIAINKFQHAN